jgi:hypothetical protein
MEREGRWKRMMRSHEDVNVLNSDLYQGGYDQQRKGPQCGRPISELLPTIE